MRTSGIKTLVLVCINYLLPISIFAQTGDSLLNQLARKWLNAKMYTLKLAELMPEEAYHYKPVPEVMSFKEQLLHMADNMQWLSSSFLFSKKEAIKKDTAKMDKPAVIAYIATAYDQALLAHYKLSQKQLNEVVPFFAGPMTRRQILILMHDHQTHHAGQLILYLRLKGIKPADYVGW
jgi:uncharacterized damage-inducible protein DinB